MPMNPVFRVEDKNSSYLKGKIVPDNKKILWNGSLIILAILTTPFYTTIDSIILFITFTYFTLLFGHSIGMHRLMIHRTFKTNIFMYRILIYIGSLVGMSGPKNIIKIHDIRDWAQRKKSCHPFFSHKANYIRDITWQLFYRFEFKNPPKIKYEKEIADDNFINFLDKTWSLQQIPLGVLFYYLGDFSYVVWGIFVRIPFSVISH